ncbi:putative hydrolase [Agrobacterium tumefaciens str. Kerr 14]|uniref:Putative hydrolase n=2 Tax=Agrobacterium tumefaciens TaxID=358 RepID=A0A1S7SAK9_AGRTU|nr:putative hydrolase [Agrobacterium tumefaciens str. Kerr 14]
MEIFGSGPPLLILHGGGGPITLVNVAQNVASRFRAILPTHPGFDGTDRPAEIATIRDLARTYAELIADAGLTDVILMGFSMGGWVAAELAACHPAGVTGLILVDAVGIAVAGQKVLNVNNMPPAEIANFSYHRPEAFRIDPSALSTAMKAKMQANFATLAVYAGDHYMQDPELAERLTAIEVPTLVLWGESDRVVHPAYGRAFAAAIPGADFRLIAECGHVPQLEQPDILQAELEQFALRISHR